MFALNKETILKMTTYVPIMKKAEFVEYAASRCFDRMEVAMEGDGLNLPMAPMYKENPQLPARYLMGALVKIYLGQEYEPVEGDDWLMSADDYDRWARSNIDGQIAQLKKQPGEVRERAFALAADFADLESRFYREISGLLNVMNDPLVRFIGTMQAQTTPEVFQRGTEELNRLKEELEAYQKAKEAQGEQPLSVMEGGQPEPEGNHE